MLLWTCGREAAAVEVSVGDPGPGSEEGTVERGAGAGWRARCCWFEAARGRGKGTEVLRWVAVARWWLEVKLRGSKSKSTRLRRRSRCDLAESFLTADHRGSAQLDSTPAEAART